MKFGSVTDDPGGDDGGPLQAWKTGGIDVEAAHLAGILLG
jgi:hypothetical protein